MRKFDEKVDLFIVLLSFSNIMLVIITRLSFQIQTYFSHFTIPCRNSIIKVVKVRF